MATLAAPCIACFDRRLMVAAGPRILVRQRATIGSAVSAAAAARAFRMIAGTAPAWADVCRVITVPAALAGRSALTCAGRPCAQSANRHG